MHLRTYIFFFPISLLVITLSSAGLSQENRKKDFERGRDDQTREEQNQRSKWMIKEVVKQGKEAEKASTQDPGRKQQLQQEIDRLQREITQHRRQEKALKEHAEKADYAAEKADASKEKKDGNQLKSTQPNREAQSPVISSIKGAIFSRESEPSEPATGSDLQGELADFSTVEDQDAAIEIPAVANRTEISGEASTSSVGFDESALSTDNQFFMEGKEEGNSSSLTVSDAGIFKAIRGLRNSTFQEVQSNGGIAPAPVSVVQIQVPSATDSSAGNGSRALEAISGALFSMDVLDGVRKLLHDQLSAQSKQKEKDKDDKKSLNDSAVTMASALSKLRGFAVQDLLKQRQAFILGSTRKVKHRIGRRTFAVHMPPG